MAVPSEIIDISRRLSREVSKLEFAPPVEYSYNPLEYARKPGEMYLEKYGKGKKEVLLVGMNPGPFGMAQTGVPFGEVSKVRDWMKISGTVKTPPKQHPKREIQGFDCPRKEVSGDRLWSWAEERYRTPSTFFNKYFVWNYCPLCFMEESGKNRTPEKLPAAERDALYLACDKALRQIVETLDPRYVIGIGAFALTRIKAALGETDRKLGTVLHPSPASPAANRGWQPQAEKQLAALGIQL